MYRTRHATSSKPEDDFILSSDPDFWTKSSDPGRVDNFSAVCLLFAKNLALNLDGKVRMKLFGFDAL